ncbi:MAG: pyridine nucleotide-disulfide oxidoreductase [Candidatus Epulonipiscioides saccharophilum]|nr:MAG: pyridine nucleotide-disulfide oxidoreductase [Epulopiscium sp. AS2M-Bin001]
MNLIEKQYDLVVVGGGMAGICAAIAAARHGTKTALVHDRPVLGGNASSEVRVGINGAGRTTPVAFKNGIESGIILELMLRNKKVNPQYSFHVQDNISWEMVNEEENIDLYLNTSMQTSHVENNKIIYIDAFQNTTSKLFRLSAKQFIDTSGDGNLAFESGADWTMGREGKDVYGESIAPDVSDNHTMGSTILYTARDTGKPVKFTRPSWAYEITADMLGRRNVHEVSNGYWWVEVGGDDLNTITDAEEIRDELLKYAYGAFDYVKNSGKYPQAENYALDWVGSVPGKRESRRIYGDYILTQNDLEAATIFEDAVAYGGWSMDAHTIGGIRAKTEDAKKGCGSIFSEVNELYTIPYRSLYSRNINNLYMGGRCISASHMAMSSTRVIGTCAVLGQAVGTAAAIANKYDILPREVNQHMNELQQTLIKDDAFLPGIPTNDTEDLISNSNCVISASSNKEGAEPHKVNGPYARRIESEENKWISAPMSDFGEWIQVAFPDAVDMNQILLRFDPNFSKYFATRITDSKRNNEEMQAELVRDYKIDFLKDGNIIKTIDVSDNFVRVNHHKFDKLSCDTVKITVSKTYGDESARISDMRIYCL